MQVFTVLIDLLFNDENFSQEDGTGKGELLLKFFSELRYITYEQLFFRGPYFKQILYTSFFILELKEISPQLCSFRGILENSQKNQDPSLYRAIKIQAPPIP